MPDSWREQALSNSKIVAATAAVRGRFQAALDSSRARQTAKQLFGGQTEPTAIDETAESQTETEQPTATATDQSPADGNESSTFGQGSVTYRIAAAIKRSIQSSWLFQWLTAEPEPDVIVIDLRDTRLIGPIITRLDRTVDQLIPATMRSRLVRIGYRARSRFRERPVRVLSLSVIAIVLVALVATATTAERFSLSSVLLIITLLVAVRGTRSKRSWDEIATSGLVGQLSAVFDPPEPPETPKEETNEQIETED
jgi:hypothetical protein